MLVRSSQQGRNAKYFTAALFGLVFLGSLFAFNTAFLGARLKFDGGIWPYLDFFPTGRHYRDLAAHRTGQQSEPLPSLPRPERVDGAIGWPAFRGHKRDGIVRGETFALPWPDKGPQVLWRQPVGIGFGSFSIHAGRAYTLEQRSEDEVVACYAVVDGRELWTYAYPALFEEAMGGPGPRSTPTYEEGRVYVLGATGVLNSLDAESGDLVWKRNILKDASAENLDWAMSGSPLVYEEFVIVAPGGAGSSVVAYDRESGDIAWRSGSYKAGYSSPMLLNLQGTEQVLVFDAAGLSAYAPHDGTPLWHYPWVTYEDINVAQPIVVDDERIFISSAYGHGCAMLRVTESDGVWEVEKIWEGLSLQLKFSSAILQNGFIYGLDKNILVCLDPQTGERRWKAGRYGYGALILANGYLIIQCENGDLALVEASPEEHREISRVDALTAKTWNHPALAEGKLLLRNDREMMCFDLVSDRAYRDY